MKKPGLLCQLILSCLLTAVPFSGALAVQITVDFTVINLNLLDPDPPTDPVSGTIVYEAASTTADIDSLRFRSILRFPPAPGISPTPASTKPQ